MTVRTRKLLFFWVSSLALCAALAASFLSREKSTYDLLISSSLFWEDLGDDDYLLALSSLRRLFEPSADDNYELKSLSSPRYLSSSLLKLTISTDKKAEAVARIARKLQTLNRNVSDPRSGDLHLDFQPGNARLLDVEEVSSPPFYLRGLQILVFCGLFYFSFFVAPSIPAKTLSLAIIAISAIVLFKVSFSRLGGLPRFEGIHIRTPPQVWNVRGRDYVHPEEIAYDLLRSRFDEGEVVSVIPDPESRTLRGLIKVTEPQGLRTLTSKLRSRVSRFLASSDVGVELIPEGGEPFERESARSRFVLLFIALTAFLVSTGVYFKSSVKS